MSEPIDHLLAAIQLAEESPRDENGFLTEESRSAVMQAYGSVDQTSQQEQGQKDMSAVNETAGGALREPPAQGRSTLVSPFRNRKVLHPNVKAMVIKKDRRGYRYCTDNGKRVKCPQTEQAEKPADVGKKPKETKPDFAKVKDRLGKVRTAEDIASLLNDVQKLTVKEIQDILKERKEKISGAKAAIVQRLRDALIKGISPVIELVKTDKPEEVKKSSVDLHQKNPDDPVAKSIRENVKAANVIADVTTLIQETENNQEYKQAMYWRDEEKRLWPAIKKAGEEYGEGSPEQTKARAKWYVAFQKIKDKKEILDGLKIQVRDKLKTLLKPENPVNITPKYFEGIRDYFNPSVWLIEPYKPSSEDENDLKFGIDFVQSITEGKGISYEVQIKQSLSGRAYFNPAYDKKPSKIRFLRLMNIPDEVAEPIVAMGFRLNEEDQRATVIHEFGHFIDELKPGAKKKIREFLKYRLGDEQPIDMGTVKGGEDMKGEMVRKDDFDRAFDEVSAYYIGKEYKDKEGKIFGTEVLSMGIEALYRDPVRFIQKDPEYAQFVIGILQM